MRSLACASTLVLMSGLLACATHKFHPLAPALRLIDQPLQPDEITLEMIDEKFGGEVFWIDARPRTAYDKGHVPGALSIDNLQRDARIFEEFEVIQDIDRQIVVYCESSRCQSGRSLANHLRERLPWDPLVLRGGWPTYRDSGRPIATNP